MNVIGKSQKTSGVYNIQSKNELESDLSNLYNYNNNTLCQKDVVGFSQQWDFYVNEDNQKCYFIDVTENRVIQGDYISDDSGKQVGIDTNYPSKLKSANAVVEPFLFDLFGLRFNNTGTKAYTVGFTSSRMIEYNLSQPWDLDTLSYSGVTTSFSSQDSAIRGFFFKPDGTKLYVIGNTNDRIYQYSLSTPFSINTAVFDNKSLPIGTLGRRESSPQGMYMSSDGYSVFYVGQSPTDAPNSRYVHKVGLTTAWQIDSHYPPTSFSISSQEGTVTGMRFGDNGTKVYVVGGNNIIYQYNLGTAWDITTASYSSLSFNVSGQDTSQQGLCFNSTGTRMFLVGRTNDRIYQYTLSTPWNISTATFNTFHSIGSHETDVSDVGISTDGTKLYVAGLQRNTFFQYNLSNPSDISSPSISKISNGSIQAHFAYFTQGFVFGDNGTKVYVVDSAYGGFSQYTLSTPWDITTINWQDKKFETYSLYELTPTGIDISSDGTKVYVVGQQNDRIYQFSLRTPWDINTMSGVIETISLYQGSSSFYNNTAGLQPNTQNYTDIFFNDTGDVFYICSNSIIYEYKLELPWNLRICYNNFKQFVPPNFNKSNFNNLNITKRMYGMFIGDNGTKLFYLNSEFSGGTEIYRPTIESIPLTRAWDLGSDDYSDCSSSCIAFYNGPAIYPVSSYAVDFSDDGQYLHVNSNGDIVQYKLDTPWDIKTIPYIQSFYHPEERDTYGMYFSPDGTKAYLAGFKSVIYQYTLSTPWDITTASYDNKNCHVGFRDQTMTTTQIDSIKFNDTGTIIFVMINTSTPSRRYLKQYALSTPWDVSTIKLPKELYVGGQEDTPDAIGFSTDGTKAYVGGTTSDRIYQYNLSTPWDLNTGTYSNKNFFIGNFQSVLQDFTFDITGEHIYIGGSGFSGSRNALVQYRLDTPWDISTAPIIGVGIGSTHIRQIGVSTLSSSPTSVAISTDGSKAYIVTNSGVNPIHQFNLSTNWAIETATYSGLTTSVSAQENNVQSISFKPDGKYCYVLGQQTDKVHQYKLSTPWQINTVGFAKSYSVFSQEPSPTSIGISTDGTRAYIFGTTNDRLYQYTLATPFDISTASYSGVNILINNAGTGNETTPTGFFFDDTGTRFYFVGQQNDRVYEFSLSTPWDITTLANTGRNFFVGTQEGGCGAIHFKPDGTKMYVVGQISDRVFQYTLSTPWNVSTATNDSKFCYIGKEDGTSQGLDFSPDGTKMFVTGSVSDKIHRYTLSVPWDVSTATYDSVFFNSTETAPTGLRFTKDGTKFYTVGQTNRLIYQFEMSIPWDITSVDSTAVFIGNQEPTPTSVTFKPDGTRFYVIGSTYRRIYEYVMTTPWNVGTAYFLGVLTEPLIYDSAPTEITFNPDGTKLYLTGTNRDSILAYTLSTPWDLTTLSINNEILTIGDFEQTPTGLHIGNDGKSVYVVGTTNRQIQQYDLKTAWDITTSKVRSFVLEANVRTNTNLNILGIYISPNGQNLYLTSTYGESVNQYKLTRPWDISSLVFTGKNISVFPEYIDGTQGNNTTRSIFFSSTGTKFYVSASNNRLFEYDVLTPWDITTAKPNKKILDLNYLSTNTLAFTFGDGGSKVYALSNTIRSAYQIDLSAPWDLSTASTTCMLPPTIAGSRSIEFSSDGTKLYLMDPTLRAVYQYNLKYPWNITDASFKQQDKYVFIGPESLTPWEMSLSSDGTKMYVMDTNAERLSQYTLSTPWDIKTTQFDNVSVGLIGIDRFSRAFYFGNNGSILYIDGSFKDRIYQLPLSTPWDISTCPVSTLADYNTVPSGLQEGPDSYINAAICFGDSGYKLYIVGTTNDAVQQYRLEKPYNITTLFYEGYTPLTAWDDSEITKIRFRDNGKSLYLLSSTSNSIYKYDLKIPWDITSISSNNISDRDKSGFKTFTFYNNNITSGGARNIYFKSDGTKVYILAGPANNISRIYEYNLLVPWDVTKIVMETENELWVGTNDTDVRSFVFSSDGSKIFVVGANNDSIYSYTLSTPWSIKTALYDYEFLPVFNDEYSTLALEFSNDGSEVYFYGNVNYGINQYSLSVPYDLRTAYYPKEFFLSEESVNTEDIFFGNSGNNMYVIDRITRAIYQYDLSTAWDITTASYDNKRFDIIGLDDAPNSLHFKDDGTKVYISGSSYTVQEVTLETPWDINTAKLGVDYQTGNSLLEDSIIPDASYQGFDFKPDGTKAYAIGDTYDQIYQYSMSTPWDVSTLSYEKKSKYYGDAETWTQSGTFNRTSHGLSFNNTGTKTYALVNQNLFQFTLSNPWEIDSLTTAKQLSVSLGSIVAETSPSSIGIATTGGKIYVIGGLTQNIFELNLSTPGDLNTASYNKKFLYAGYQEPTPTGLTFDFDGLNAYVVGNSRNTVTQYKLSTSWDVSSGVNTCGELFVDSLETSPTSVAISTDGTKAYVCGITSDRIYQYTLNEPWNIGIATYSGLSTSVASQDGTPQGLFFKPDGSTLYLVGSATNRIYQYTLTQPWNIGIATYSGKSLLVSSQLTDATSVGFASTGDKLFVVGSGGTIFQYNCTTPWDVSTSSYSGISTFIGHIEGNCQSLSFNSDGTKAFVSGLNRFTVFRFSMSNPWNITTLTLDNNSFSPYAFDTSPREVIIENNGSTMYFVGNTNRKIYQINLDTPWDLSSSQKFGSYYLGFDDSAITDLEFNSDGTKLYITGNTNDATYEYNLETPWNVGTIVHKTQNVFSIGSQQPSITGVSIGKNGNTMFIVGTNANDLTHEYNLRSPYDIATSLYSGLTIPISTQDNNTQDIAFGDSGNIMYTIGRNTNTVYQYSLGAPWSSTGASYENVSLSIASQENLPTSVYVSGDGRKLYVLGQNTCAVHQYSIPEETAWNISTASYDNVSFSILSEELIPQSIAFNDSGTRMYIIGSNNRTIYQYNLGSAWNVSTSVYSGKKLFVGNNIGSPVGLSFSDDGTIVYIANDGGGDNIHQFKLDNAWEINTRSGYFWSADYTSKYGSLAAISSVIHFRDDDIQGIEISSDGTKLYLLKNTTDSIYQYNLSIPYNVNSAVYADKMLYVGLRENAPLGIKFNNEGTILYVTGSQLAVISQYNLSTAWDISTANSLVIDTSLFSNANRDLTFSSDGNELYIVGDSSPTSQDNTVYQRSLLRSYDISTIENYRFYHGLTGTSMWFSSDGTQCYVLQQSGNDTIFQYTLTTPWDITTAWNRGLSLQVGNITGVTENNGVGIFIGNNGTKLYTIGTSNNTVYEFTLSVRNVISTGTYTNRSFSVAPQTTGSRDLKFSYDGTKMFVLCGSCSIFEYTLSIPWDVSTASYSSVSYSVADLEYLPNTICFSDDGSRLYISGTSNDSVYEYSLSTPWSLSSVTFTNRRKYIGGDEKTVQEIFIGNNGNTLYVTGTYTASIYQYQLSIPWNINTTNTPFSLFTLDIIPSAVGFNTTGTKMFISGGYESRQARLYEYDLTTPWKISTASYSDKSISTMIQRNGQVSSYVPSSFKFKPDGSSLFLCDASTCRIHKLDFSTPWDIATSSRNTLNVAYQDYPNSILFNDTGSRMYMVGSRFSKIFQYNLTNPWNVGTTLPLKSFHISSTVDLNDLSFSENGRQLYVLNATNNVISQYTLLTPWDIGSILEVRTDSISLNSQQATNNPRGIFFANNGFKVYMIGVGSPIRVYEYDLSIRYNIASATYVGNFIAIAEDTFPQGLFFKPDGTKMYLVGSQKDRVYQYNLSTPWTITSATYENKSFADFMEMNGPTGLYIGDNGTKLYVLSQNNNYIPTVGTGVLYNRLLQYTLTTPWDVSTAQYIRHFTIGQGTNLTGIYFNSDGTKFFVSGRDATSGFRVVQEFSMSTPWNIGTVQISDGLFVGDRDNSITGIVFSNDGTKLYVGGRTTATIYQYNLSTPWDVRTGTYANKLFYHSLKQGGFSGFRFNDSGTELYLVGTGYDVVYQYQLSTPWDISTSKKKQYSMFWELGVVNSIKFNDSGTKLYAASSTQNQIKQYSLSTPWNINTLNSYKKLNVNYVIASGRGVGVSSDGKIMHVLSNDRRIYQFYMTTPWDVRTAFYSNEQVFINEDSSPQDFVFDSSGTRLFFLGDANDRVQSYTLNEPWNISSVIVVNTASPSFTSQDPNPTSIGISTIGHRVYVAGNNQTVYQYNLSTNWDLSTFSYSGLSTVISVAPNITSICFNTSGTRMYVASTNNDTVYQYNLSTPWEINTAVYSSNYLTTRYYDNGTSVAGIDISQDGMNLFAIDNRANIVYQYELGVSNEIGCMKDIMSIEAYDNSLSGVFVKDYENTNQSSLYVLGNQRRNLIQYNFDNQTFAGITTHYGYFPIAGATGGYELSAFSSDGTKMFLFGGNALSLTGISTTLSIQQFSSNTPWDISTFTPDYKSFYIGNQEISPYTAAFRPNGTNFYVLGINNDTIYQYDISTPWEINTSSYSGKSYNVGLYYDSFPSGLAFSDDGRYVYFTGQTNVTGYTVNNTVTAFDMAWQVELTTPWDISTARSYPFGSLRLNMNGNTVVRMVFADNGKKLYFGTSTQGRLVFAYDLAIPWNINTAVLANGERTPTLPANSTYTGQILFNPNGTRVFYNTSSIRIFQFDLNPERPWTFNDNNSRSHVFRPRAVSIQSFRFSKDMSRLHTIGISYPDASGIPYNANRRSLVTFKFKGLNS